MLKLTFSPTEAEVAAAIDAAPAKATKDEVLKGMVRRTKEVEVNDGDNFAIEKYGVRYTDSETGLVHMTLFNMLESVELKMDVSKFQSEYASAFVRAKSDRQPQRRALIDSGPGARMNGTSV